MEGPPKQPFQSVRFTDLERQVQAQLQEPRAPDCMLDHSQAALRRNRRWPGKVREEIHIVVGRIERGMIEDVERVCLKA